MKKQTFFAFGFAALLMAACGGESSNSTENGEDSEEVVELEVEKKTCYLTAMEFELMNKERTIKFEHENGKVSSSKLFVQGEDKNQDSKYERNENGQLTQIMTGASILKYVYDSQGKLMSIDGGGNFNTRTFEYNAEGQIVKQVTMFGSKPYMTHLYEYNEEGLPVMVTILDKSGAETDVSEITYDDKRNPFKGMGASSNSMEMMMGYPVGNCEHNVINIKKTYKKKSSYKIQGKYKMPGDVDENEITFEYNEDDYPVSMSRKSGENTRTVTLSYDCE